MQLCISEVKVFLPWNSGTIGSRVFGRTKHIQESVKLTTVSCRRWTDDELHILKLCEAIFLKTASITTRSSVSYCSGTAPMCCTTKSQSSAGDGMDKVDSNLSLQFRAEKSHTDSLRHVCVELGGRAMPRELSFHPAQAIQASHRPSYGLELLKHGEHVGSAHSTVVDELYPKSLEDHTQGAHLHGSLPIQAALLGGVRFASWLADPSWAAQQKPLMLLALWKGGTHTGQDVEAVAQRCRREMVLG